MSKVISANIPDQTLDQKTAISSNNDDSTIADSTAIVKSSDAVVDEKAVDDETTVDELSAGEFTIVSIEKTKAPDGTNGKDWYRYVVARNNSEIVGNMRGTLKQVELYTKEFVDNLNLRCQFPASRSPWAPTSTQRKKG